MDWLGAISAGAKGYVDSEKEIRKERQAKEDGELERTLRKRQLRDLQQQDQIESGSPLDVVQPQGAMNIQPPAAAQPGGPALGLDMAQPQQPKQVQQQDPELGQMETVYKGLNQRRAAALQAGRYDLWDNYGKQADTVRNRLISRVSQQGFQRYQLSGDLNDLLPAANLVHDGMEFKGVKRNEDGSIIVETAQFGGAGKPLTYKTEQEAMQALRDYIDPASASARAKRTDDMIWKIKETEGVENAKADAKNREPQKLSPGETVRYGNGTTVRAPFKPQFGTIKNPGDGGGESVLDELTGNVRPGPGGGGGSGGSGGAGPAGGNGMPAYARLFPGSKNLEKDVQDITGKMIPETGLMSADGKTNIPAEQARLEFQSNLARVAASNPNLTDLPTVAKTARALTLQQLGQDVPGYSKPTIARDFNTGRMQAEVQTPEGRVVIPSDMAKASPVQAIQADEAWMRKVFSNKPLYDKVDAIMKDPQGQAAITQALQDPQARQDFEQRSGLPIELFRTVAAWRIAKGEQVPYPTQADPGIGDYIRGIQQFKSMGKKVSGQASAAPSKQSPAQSIKEDPLSLVKSSQSSGLGL